MRDCVPFIFLVNLNGFYVFQKKEPCTPFLGPPVQPEHPQTSPGHPHEVYPPGRRPHPVRMGVGVFLPSLGPKPYPKYLCYTPVSEPSKFQNRPPRPATLPAPPPVSPQPTRGAWRPQTQPWPLWRTSSHFLVSYFAHNSLYEEKSRNRSSGL